MAICNTDPNSDRIERSTTSAASCRVRYNNFVHRTCSSLTLVLERLANSHGQLSIEPLVYQPRAIHKPLRPK